ncbi:FRG domain-containing protein [Staphylococcus caeli]|uniref:FRG domain n=1 Tax=Staphylococcus caeli TaxID=2201815 RepID=A0A1D4IYK2_9STAP|nr:FRG domain-containing protein [Staphylococcus caeli]SCS36452.1 FRG domain [Staphylococcus caeli]SCS54436.1 FRG domain [Staphylococcus caeli]
MGKIKNISEFIKEIQQATDYFKSTLGIDMVCYRGESKKHDYPGMPNLFRNPNYRGRNFEKNILDEVITNKLSENKNYLQAAMNAQHGGFPSRLLDVSFNSLIALFFAVTPHFTEDIDSRDDNDGKVFIYAIDKMYSSNNETIQRYFENMLNGKIGLNRLQGYVHRLIDYTNLNERIKAQQGGLILFSGNDYISIPEWKTKIITIDCEFKEQIRTDLKQLFGINMGSIYPESEHLVNYLTDKALLLAEHNDYQDLLYELDRQINFFLTSIFDTFENEKYRAKIKFLMQVEKYLLIYTQSIREFKVTETSSEFKAFKNSVNCKISEFIDNVNYYLPKGYTFIPFDKLSLKKDEE